MIFFIIIFMLLLFQPEGLEAISKHFPFLEYFSNAPQPLFKGNSFDEDWDIAQVHVHIHTYIQVHVLHGLCL